MQTQSSHRIHNGQAFVLHIWDSQQCKRPKNIKEDEWSSSFIFLNYLTHKTGIAAKSFAAKMNWLAYIDSF